MTLDSKIEAILFFKGEPVRISELASILSVPEEDIQKAVSALSEKMEDRGVQVMENDGRVMLVTAPDIGSLIEKIVKEELSKDLGKAGLETLTIVLYRGPVTRAEIDYIRGVNSTFILRNLLVRGLVEKKHNPGDLRSFLYGPTFELLSYLGISSVSKLPEYDSMRGEVDEFEKTDKKNDDIAESPNDNMNNE